MHIENTGQLTRAQNPLNESKPFAESLEQTVLLLKLHADFPNIHSH